MILPSQGLSRVPLEAQTGLSFRISELWVVEGLVCVSPAMIIACDETTHPRDRSPRRTGRGKPVNPSVFLLLYSGKKLTLSVESVALAYKMSHLLLPIDDKGRQRNDRVGLLTCRLRDVSVCFS